ncbi:hypothetical protein Bhyg_09047 [Pseudolycoriella hygida]|uniref:Uncharacterized protein n=1 Tax=Pseudolycoriella hygida TaxID=35572 RepID=A0A9Q0N6R2_9DIPT|nr:hypothetical protein Bhyg_09047 [Pseudolycoriella hygida]
MKWCRLMFLIFALAEFRTHAAPLSHLDSLLDELLAVNIKMGDLILKAKFAFQELNDDELTPNDDNRNHSDQNTNSDKSDSNGSKWEIKDNSKADAKNEVKENETKDSLHDNAESQVKSVTADSVKSESEKSVKAEPDVSQLVKPEEIASVREIGEKPGVQQWGEETDNNETENNESVDYAT